MTDHAAQAGPAAAKPSNNVRSRAMTIAFAVIAVIAIGYAIYWFTVGSRFVSTEDAYVGADTALVTPLTGGAVKAVLVKETQFVRAGDPLVQIDEADAKLSVMQAAAELGKSERRVNQYLATDVSLQAQLAARDTDIARAKAQLAQAQSNAQRTALDLERRSKVVSTGAVSQEELSTAKDLAAASQANLAAAEAGLAQAVANRKAAVGQADVNLALVRGTNPANNPEVVSARSRLDQAKLDLSRTVVSAPVAGIVSKRQVQVGQKVQAGATLMSIVPVEDAYVDANFKEVELRKVKIGQPVELTSDLYGDGVKFHGRVTGFSGGTGSAFAVIPAQNATGNWIKVVQRLAVRITLDPSELAKRPLRVGLSMKAKIDVAKGA
jgi:membrane fusion protein (multidrug efflux system)